MTANEQELESARFRQKIARAWRRRDRLRRWSYNLGYVAGRIAHYCRILRRLASVRSV